MKGHLLMKLKFPKDHQAMRICETICSKWYNETRMIKLQKSIIDFLPVPSLFQLEHSEF